MVLEPSSPYDAFAAELRTRCFDELERGEQLVLWSVRAIALGHADCPTLGRVLSVSLGSSAEEAFTSLFVAVRLLGGSARRRFCLHAPGCDRVAQDEHCLLDLFAAAQQALADGDERDVRSLLDELAAPGSSEGLLMILQSVASALEVNGYGLPSRAMRLADVPASRSLH